MGVSLHPLEQTAVPQVVPYTPKLELINISKGYETDDGRLTVLDDVSLTVDEGQFVCVVGPSGCGKSTLFNIVAGLDQADSGRLRVDGKDVSGPGQDRVVVFQDGALFPWLTVLENVAFGLKVQGVGRQEREDRAAAMLQLVRLARFSHHRIHQLSGGMRQRVALARALVLQPPVLLMDEPFGALDAQTRNVLHTELGRLCALKGTTVLFVTHNVEEATKLGDRVVVMSFRPGRVLLDLFVPISRPRQPHDPRLQKPIHRVLQLLTHEVERASQEEMGADA